MAEMHAVEHAERHHRRPDGRDVEPHPPPSVGMTFSGRSSPPASEPTPSRRPASSRTLTRPGDPSSRDWAEPWAKRQAASAPRETAGSGSSSPTGRSASSSRPSPASTSSRSGVMPSSTRRPAASVRLRACRCPPQLELRAEVARDRAHVRAGAAAQVDPDVEPAVPRAHVQQVDRVDRDRPRRQRDRLPGAGGAVRGATAELPRAERRRPLVEGADEARQGAGNGRVRRHRPADDADRSLAVIGLGGLSQPDHRVVALAAAGELLAEAGGGPDEDRQHARGQRIERAGVTDPPRAGEAPHEPDHVVAGGPDRLVEVNDPEHRRGRARARTRPGRGASPRRAVRSPCIPRRGRGRRRRIPT